MTLFWDFTEGLGFGTEMHRRMQELWLHTLASLAPAHLFTVVVYVEGQGTACMVQLIFFGNVVF